MTKVSADEPQSQIDYEIKDLQDKINRMQLTMDSIPAEIAVMAEHQKLQDERAGERFKDQQDFEWRVVYGLFGTCGTLGTMAVGWLLHNMGISFGVPKKKRRHGMEEDEL